MIEVIVLGSTGSIGNNTLRVIDHLKTAFHTYGIAGYRNVDALIRQAKRFRPKYAVVLDKYLYKRLKQCLPRTKVLAGVEGMMEMVEDNRADYVVVALRGVIGLKPTLSALERIKRVCLATKEILVSYGTLLKKYLGPNKLAIIPVDSEHSAIHQCIFGKDYGFVKNLYLTSSGGPFFKKREEVLKAKIEDVLNHPTWRMGKKITVDSATLMNKGLEVIEASRLFGCDGDKIKVLIHPQSIVHSLVEFVDHSVIGQLSVPDMRLPIQYALTFPKRMKTLTKPCDLSKIRHLDFYAPNFNEFPCLRFAYQALKIGGTMPAVLNGANETAVNLFLDDKIKFCQIPDMLSKAMALHKPIKNPCLKDIKDAEDWAVNFIKAQV